MSQEHENLITKGIKEVQTQRNIQGDQDSISLQIQAAQHTNANVTAGASKEKQHDKGEKAIWQNNHDHNLSLRNNPHSSQNELGKGQVNMQADVNEAYGQTEKTASMGHNIEIKAPPPVKISSNLDIY
ncbi:hypothetical protein RDI58_017653 [Solanum bulbocastanum]|uniref:Uncharacterized protein n=1 Tax=Solanum bulbocastanum TaxID=147425 RepID=A0AAN8TA88_SOLBU